MERNKLKEGRILLAPGITGKMKNQLPDLVGF